MSTNKTPNYHLHSWHPDDDFLRSEMNDNFTAIDTAIKSEATAAAQARATLKTQLTGAINTGDSALQAAINTGDAALQAAINTLTARCGQLQEVMGTYVGSGNTLTQDIVLGFHPKAVLVLTNNYHLAYAVATIGLALDGVPMQYYLTITDNGFQVKGHMNGSDRVGQTTELYNPYRYLAWR